VAGSYAAMMLADMGAAVVKVESLAGDSFRELPGFLGWNRGKRSLAVDLKTDAGRAVLDRLATRADVALENMRPGVADRLGAGWARLSALNPRLVYCSITAFGPTGPDAGRPGFDPLFQALGGVMALQGFGGPPQYVRIAVTDYYAAALASQAILAALFARERTGRGQKVETSLVQAVLALQSGNVVFYPDQDTRRPLALARLRQPVLLGKALQGTRPGRARGRPALCLLDAARREPGRALAAPRGALPRVLARGVARDAGRSRRPVRAGPNPPGVRRPAGGGAARDGPAVRASGGRSAAADGPAARLLGDARR